jgi:hypothetical protein
VAPVDVLRISNAIYVNDAGVEVTVARTRPSRGCRLRPRKPHRACAFGQRPSRRRDQPARHEDDPLEDRDVERIVATIRSRVLRLLRRRGLWSDDEHDADGDLDPSPLTQITAAAVQGKLAFDPTPGAPAPRLRQTPDPRSSRTKKKLCAECDGFTLHAGVCIPGYARERLEKLARYAARPAVVEDFDAALFA